MTYQVILSLDQPNKSASLDDLNIVKGFLHQVGFQVSDIVDITAGQTKQALLLASDDPKLMTFVEKTAKYFKQSTALFVTHTGFSYTYYFNTGMKVYEQTPIIIDRVCKRAA